jgi:RHS repeat-associated protein
VVTNTKKTSRKRTAAYRLRPLALNVLLMLIVTTVMTPPAPVRSAQPIAETPVLDQIDQALSPHPATSAGQSATLLPDGRWLLVGGLTHPGQLQVLDLTSTQVTGLPVQLSQPRSDHAAILMPDGTVLILGGRGADGAVVGNVEQFDPSTSTLTDLGNLGLTPRSHQGATVLADGRLLIAGGVGGDGRPLLTAEIYNPPAHEVEVLPEALDAPRIQPLTSLTADGAVLLWSGTDANGRPLNTAAVFDPSDQTFATVDRQAAQRLIQNLSSAAAPTATLGRPASGSNDFAVSDPLVVRFDQRMDVTSLNDQTVTLIGPNGATAAKVRPVDNGLLLFVTPAQDLMPAANYTLFLSGTTHASGRPLAFTALGFTTMALNASSNSNNSVVSATSSSGQQTANRASAAQAEGTGTNSPRIANPASAAVTASAKAPSAQSRTAASTLPTDKVRSGASKTELSPSTDAPTDDGERWIPTADNYRGRWTSGHKAFAKRSMPQNDLLERALYGHPEILALKDTFTPAAVASGVLRKVVPPDRLVGPRGMTAVTGQALKLTGKPLRDVTLSIGAQSVRTDANGEFTLTGVPAGHQILTIDGGSANQGGHQYGRYEYGMNVVAGQTNVLPFVIWMTALDTRHAMTINSPTTAPTVLTDPEIPGLELRIPAGTVIRDSGGKIVTKISMTAIPTDQPPFPLPNFPVPTYFTIQPGAAHLEGSAGNISRGAQLIYPNFTRSAPGTRINFWNYDATGKGWYIYGQGTVTPNGNQIMPDPRVVIYEFSGAMVALPSVATAGGPVYGGCDHGDPVDCFTGLFVDDEVDLKVADVIPIEVHRTYRQSDNTSRAFGIGTNLSYDMYAVGTSLDTPESGGAYTYQDVILPDGSHIHYPRVSPGTGFTDAVYQNTTTPGEFFGSVIINGGPGAFWSLTRRDGITYGFPDAEGATDARIGAITAIVDRNGKRLNFTRDSNGNLTQITSPNDRHLNFVYDSSNRITQASDDLGRTVGYSYDSHGRLAQVTDPAGHTEKYTYDSNNNMLTVTDKRGHVKVTNTYDSNNRVIHQAYADGTTSSFAYTLDSTGSTVAQTDFTDQRGSVTRMVFNASGYPTQVIDALGLPEQQTLTYNRDSSTNLVNRTTDTLGRTTALTYDALGNTTQVTRLAGTSNAASVNAQYNSTFAEPTQITDPNGHTTQFAYDVAGNLLQVTDPLNHASSFTYDSLGRPLSMTDANGNTTSLSYFGADLSVITDPLGNKTFVGSDSVGRPVSVTDALGAQTARVYDALDEPTSSTDPTRAQLLMGYDENGNVLTLTDANKHSTTYTFDALNRPLSKTDPLLNAESYAYEPGGLINQRTDRKSQVSGWTYDGLGRATQIGFGATPSHPTAYTTTIAKTWDAGNRLTKIVDSASGTITRVYNGLDHLTQEVTPQGSVSYTYDTGGRRTSMTVQGQPATTYSWDAADRLTQIQQAAGSANGSVAQTFTFQYDNANRRTQVALSNGIKGAYAYDTAGHLTGITYTRANGTAIGNLTYTYDGAGHRTSVGGSLANVNVPATAFSASYDANNRLAGLNGLTPTYDANGNTLSDGTNSYTWDERDQTHSVTGAVNASFQYDPDGRRVQKTIGSTTTRFLYDGANYVEEQNSGGTWIATELTAGVDEVFARMTSAGIAVPIADAQGSMVAETNSTQTVTTAFAYEPYGKTSQTGAGSGNAQQYTGRENDGTGLYYYRARYYSPATGRFISEDPIGFSGGPNAYAYANGNPISITDPLGLWGLFGFGSIETSGPPGSPVRVGAEGVALGGYDSNKGWYAGVIGALGHEVGGTQNYYAHYTGIEKTTGCEPAKPIDLKYLSLGPEILELLGFGGGVGLYHSNDETGLFFYLSGSVIGDHGSAGVGFPLFYH